MLLVTWHHGFPYSNPTGISQWCHHEIHADGNKPDRCCGRPHDSLRYSESNRGRSCWQWTYFRALSAPVSLHWSAPVLWFRCCISWRDISVPRNTTSARAPWWSGPSFRPYRSWNTCKVLWQGRRWMTESFRCGTGTDRHSSLRVCAGWQIQILHLQSVRHLKFGLW